jgi:hypothetical protein
LLEEIQKQKAEFGAGQADGADMKYSTGQNRMTGRGITG